MHPNLTPRDLAPDIAVQLRVQGTTTSSKSAGPACGWSYVFPIAVGAPGRGQGQACGRAGVFVLCAQHGLPRFLADAHLP